MKRLAHTLLLFLFAATSIFAADNRLTPSAATAIRKAALDTTEAGMAGVAQLSAFTDRAAAELALRLVREEKASPVAKEQLAAAVYKWPAGSEGRKALLDFFNKNRTCDLEALRFLAGAGMAETEPIFADVMEKCFAVKPTGSALIAPDRLAVALSAYALFPGVPDNRVTRIAGFLGAAYPHPVRAAAAATLGALKSRAALPALIANVTDDAIGETARISLFRLTGETHGEDVKKWDEWLKGSGAAAELKMLALAEWQEHVKKQAEAEKPQYTSAFYGIPYRAKGSLFILDVSSSMAGYKIEQLKNQMTTLLDSLKGKPQTRFNILTFNRRLDECAPLKTMLLNDDAGLKKAGDFVKKIDTSSGTGMVKALSHALEKMLPHSNVDTIYFLTDGLPNDGTQADVLNMIARIHRDHYIRIHCVEILNEEDRKRLAQANGPSLLQKIAHQTGGTCVNP
jgi:uncharacterized protein YegL